MNKTVLKEVKTAYADANMGWEQGKNLRQLMFKASEFVEPEVAVAIALQAIPRGYNEFKADLLGLFPEHARIQLAREYSVCVYVSGVTPNTSGLPSQSELMADEYDWQKDGTLRIWWD
jgi:hypothetical protein